MYKLLSILVILAAAFAAPAPEPQLLPGAYAYKAPLAYGAPVAYPAIPAPQLAYGAPYYANYAYSSAYPAPIAYNKIY